MCACMRHADSVLLALHFRLIRIRLRLVKHSLNSETVFHFKYLTVILTTFRLKVLRNHRST